MANISAGAWHSSCATGKERQALQTDQEKRYAELKMSGQTHGLVIGQRLYLMAVPANFAFREEAHPRTAIAVSQAITRNERLQHFDSSLSLQKAGP